MTGAYHASIQLIRRFLHADERGSIIAVAENAGTAPAINSYDEYGIPGAANQGRFQYTGQAYLPEFGLYHYKARAYAPTLGRFLQTDLIGYDDGMNPYDYVSGDPVNAVDPEGKFLKFIVKGIALIGKAVIKAAKGAAAGKGAATGAATGDIVVKASPIVTAANVAAGTATVAGTTVAASSLASPIVSSKASPQDTNADDIVLNARPQSPVQFKLPATHPICAGLQPNGCGTADGHWPPQIFPRSCNSHDICYGTLGANKLQCDLQFLRDMRAENSHLDSRFRMTFFTTVVFGGQDAFERAQQAAALCR